MEKNPQHLCTPSPSRGKSPAALSVWCKSLGCPKNRVEFVKFATKMSKIRGAVPAEK